MLFLIARVLEEGYTAEMPVRACTQSFAPSLEVMVILLSMALERADTLREPGRRHREGIAWLGPAAGKR